MTNARPNKVGTGAVDLPGGQAHGTATNRPLTTVPAADVVAVHPGRTAREVTVRCPYCSELHRHLWPSSAEVVGTRVAHCSTWSPRMTYWVPTPGLEVTR